MKAVNLVVRFAVVVVLGAFALIAYKEVSTRFFSPTAFDEDEEAYEELDETNEFSNSGTDDRRSNNNRRRRKRDDLDFPDPDPEPRRQPAARSRSTSSTGGESSLEKLRARREKCEKQLQKAEEEKSRYQASYDEGVAERAVIDTTGPRNPSGGVRTPPIVGRDQNGNPIYGARGSQPAKVNVEGARVSCYDAERNPRDYPREGKKCAGITRKIEAADARIQKALECVRTR